MGRSSGLGGRLRSMPSWMSRVYGIEVVVRICERRKRGSACVQNRYHVLQPYS